jgi:hypothetical protein
LREPGEKLNPDCIAVTVKHSSSRMFWGCYTYRELGPIVPLKSSVTGQTHAKIIYDYVVPTLDEYFPYGNEFFKKIMLHHKLLWLHVKMPKLRCFNDLHESRREYVSRNEGNGASS